MITDIISTIIDLFKAGSELRGARAEQRDAALDAIYMACTETKIYVMDWERTSKRNKKKEQELARLWKKASIPARHFDHVLADKCYYKGDYWLNPDHWDNQDIVPIFRFSMTPNIPLCSKARSSQRWLSLF